MKIHIARGNTKLGSVLNISLPPGVTCRAGAPCLKDCYARKHCYALYPGTRKAWNENLKLYQTNRTEYFAAIFKKLERARKPGLFRWHVGGDIPDTLYLRDMIWLAHVMPTWKFLAFTKRYAMLEWNHLAIPPNLRIVLSGWPGLPLRNDDLMRLFPVAWMRDPKNPDERIPKTAKHCPGNCTKCGKCWALKPGESVVFDKH